MNFLKTDLARNFGVGFLVGTLAVVLANPALAHLVTGLM